MSFFRRKHFEAGMDDELRFHMEAYAGDLVRSGVDPKEAQRRARLEFGAVEATKDECRQAWGFERMDELRADLRLTFRTLRQNPGFAAVAILSLALGVGANTAIFGLVDAVMLRELPVSEPERLVFVENVGTEGRNGGPPYPCFELLRDKAQAFSAMAAFSPSNLEVVIDGGREQVRGLYVSGNFYEMLGLKPLLGRTLSASDDRIVGRGGPDGPVAVISRSYWHQRFGGDPAVVGRVFRMFDQSVTIIGVMPRDSMSVEPGRPIDIAVPMMLSDPASLRNRGAWWLEIVARLKPGVRPEQARAEADALFQAYMATVKISAEFRKLAFDRIEISPAAKGGEGLRRQFEKPLTALTILVGLVLLAACANVANLMLARAASRQKEFAVRLAIGAGRGRLIRQTLTEALVLVGLGGALGAALAVQGEVALANFFSDGADRIVLDLSMNSRVLLFTLAISLLTGVAFGLLPALRAARVDPSVGLQSGARSIAGSRRGLRLGRTLVAVQVALSMVLLAGAGLFIRSLRQLENVDLGFAREGILTMEVTPERELYGKPEWLSLEAQILDRLRALPGVRSASWSSMSPLSGRDRGASVAAEGFVPRAEIDTHVHMISVSPEYFGTWGVTLLVGRGFTARDESGAPMVAILNETAARFYFGTANPLGKKITFTSGEGKGGIRGPSDPQYEIAGVVKDAKHASVRGEPWRFVYLPVAQSLDRINRQALAVRCTGNAMMFVGPVAKEIRSVHSALLITNVSTVEKDVARSLMRDRLVSTLSSSFGVLALVLASIGLYGLMAYAVTRRTNEIGIRMALGATGTGMIWLVLREALALAAAGIAIGVPLVVGLGRITRTLLFGVAPFDIPVFAGAVAVLLLFAAIAGVVPARRAGRLDPMSALRCE